MPPARIGVAVAAAIAVFGLLLGSMASGAPERPSRPTTTSARAAELARQAVTDDAALSELRAIRSIDGQPVDLGAVTADLGPDRAARLTALAAAVGAEGAPAAPSSAARASAREVLSHPKYQPSRLPRPFKGLLDLLAKPLRPVFRQIGRWLRPILDLPGGRLIVLGLVSALVGGCIALLISRRSRAAIQREHHERGLVDPQADPAVLDAAADEAEAAGELAAAVRLRYEAGLIRLVSADRVELKADTTASVAAAQVGLPAMDRLTADFEQVVYGGRAATADDVARARSGWADVLGVRSRR